MTGATEWPREIWMAKRQEHDQGVVSAVLSEWATVARFEGDKEREREFHRYVDGDIYDSAEKYWRTRLDEANTRTDTIPSPDALIRAALEAAAKKAWIKGWMHPDEIASTIRALADDPEALAAIVAKAEGRG